MRISPTTSKMRPKGRVRLVTIDAHVDANLTVIDFVKCR